MWKAKLALMTLLLALALSSAALAQQQPEVAATVNGQAITMAQVTQGALARYGDEVLDNLIVALAIEQAANEAGISVSTQDLQQRYEDAERQVELRAPITGINFAAWLQMNQMTPEFFRQNIYLSLLLDRLVAPQVSITDRMVADYYQRNRERLRQPEQVRVAHICVSEKEEAEKIRAQIQEGAVTFEEAAKAHSIDPWTKDIGGDFGYIVAGEDPFQQAAFVLTADGEMSPVVQTRMGFHIIKRLEKRPSQIPPFEEIQEQLKRSMERERLTRLASEKRQQILQNAGIERDCRMPAYPLSDAQRALEADVEEQ